MLSQQVAVDRVFHALGDPTRRAIVEKLSHGPISVSVLAKPLDRTCRIEPKGLSVAEKWIEDRRSLWERRLDRLGALLWEPEE